MHARTFERISLIQSIDFQTALFAAGCGGILLGCMAARAFPAQVLYSVSMGALGSGAGLFSGLFVSLLPLALAAFFIEVWNHPLPKLLPMALDCALLSFTVCAMVSAFGISGVVPAVLLLLDRMCGLFFLVWFLCRERRKGSFLPDFLFAAMGTALGTVLFSCLLSPLITSLFESVFISM